MYSVEKTLEISAAHRLELDYTSKCANLHGHNWRITVFCKSEKLDRNGMVIDFSRIKVMIQDKIDHKFINEVLPFKRTAENLAKGGVDTVPNCYRVRVQESAGNVVEYDKEA